MTALEIQKICENTGYGYFGFRADNMEYQKGDICNNSHQLFQDPDFDEYGNIIYEKVDNPESPYYGFYDAGELSGSCAVRFDPESKKSILSALEAVKIYSGKNLYIIAGDSAEYGNDEGEIIIIDAEIIRKVEI